MCCEGGGDGNGDLYACLDRHTYLWGWTSVSLPYTRLRSVFVCLQTWKHDLPLIFGHRPSEACFEHIVVCSRLPGLPVVDASLTGLGAFL